MGANDTGPAPRTLTTDAQLIQDYLQSAGLLVNPGAGQIATLVNAEGQAEAVVIDPSGNVFHACREPLSDSGWNMYGIGAGFQSLAAVDSATIWARGNDGTIWRSDHGRWSQTSTLPGGSPATGLSAGTDGAVWAADSNGVLYVMGATPESTPPAVNAAIAPVLTLDSGGLLNCFCVDGQGALWSIRQRVVGGSWGPWANLGTPSAGVTLTRIAIAPNQDGRLQAFALGSDGGLYTIYQQSLGGNWSGWQQWSSSGTAVFAVGQNQDGRLELFALSSLDGAGNAALSHMWQTAPSDGWSAWADMGAPAGQHLSDLAVVQDESGCLQLVLVSHSTTNGAWVKQSAPNNGWTSWQALPGAGQCLSAPSIVQNEDGHLELFALAADGEVVHLWQESGAWQQWATLGTPIPGTGALALAVGRNADGGIELFAQSNAQIFTLGQTAPNNGWSSWACLGAPSPEIGLATLAVARNRSGALVLIALGTDSAPWQATGGPSTGWIAWVGHWWNWYPIPSAPPLSGMPSGCAGDFWAIDSCGRLAHWDGVAWTSTMLPDSLQASCLTVDGEGTAWILATDPPGTLWRLAGITGGVSDDVCGAFEQLPGSLPGANSIGGSGSRLWATAAVAANQFALYAYRNGAWQSASSPNLLDLDWNNDAQVSVGRDGSVWVLDGSGNAWKQTMAGASGSWDGFPLPLPAPTLRFISAASGGAAWGLDASGGIWQFHGAWVPFNHPLPGTPIAQISGGPQRTLWAIDIHGTPYAYTTQSGWQPIGAQFDGPLVQSPTTWALAAQGAYQYQAPSGSSPATWVPRDAWGDYVAQQLAAGRDGTVVVLDSAGTLHALSPTPLPLASAPPQLVQIAVVDATHMWGITRDATTGAYALHVCGPGGWEQVATSTALFEATSVAPQLSSAADGTVWVLDGGGVPRRLRWSPRQIAWLAKGQTTSLQAIAAANINAASITTPEAQEAWAVTGDGTFRRSFGNRWTDTHTSLPNGAAAAQISVGTDGSVWAVDSGGGLYAKQAWNQAPGGAVVAGGLDGQGGFHLFTVDAGGALWVAQQESGATTWFGWQQLGATGAGTGLVAGATQEGGALNAFWSSGGVVYHTYQDASAGSGWSPFLSLGQPPSGVGLTTLAIGHDAAGVAYVFGIGADGSAWFITEDPSSASGWTGWTALPVSATLSGLGGAGLDAAGALEVFAIDDQGLIYRCWRPSGAATAFSDWQVMSELPAQTSLSSPSVGAPPGGPLYVLAVGGDDAIYASCEQPSQPTGWSAWNTIGSVAGVTPQSLSTATGSSGVLTAFMQGSDGGIYTSALTTTGSTWSALGATGTKGTPLAALIALTDPSGTIRVFATGGGSVWQTWPHAGSASGWSDWGRLSGPQQWKPLRTALPLACAPSGSATALWAVLQNGNIEMFDGAAWRVTGFPGGAISVSVGTDGAVWAVTETDCYRYDASSEAWTLAGTNSFKQAPVGSSTDLWALDADGRIWRSRDGGSTWWQDPSFPRVARQLSACADGSVWLVDQNGTAWLAAGWQRVMRPTGMPGFAPEAGVSQVAAGQDEHGTRYLFFVLQGRLLYTYEIARHAWLEPIGLGDSDAIASVATTNQQDTGELIAYVPLPDAWAIGLATKIPGDRYQFSYTPVQSFTLSPQYEIVSCSSLELSALDAGRWYWFGVGADGVGLMVAISAGLPDEVDFYSVEAAPFAAANQILPLPWPRLGAAPFCAVIDAAGQLWMAADIVLEGSMTATFLPLTGANTPLPDGPRTVAALLQADFWTPPQPRLYAVGDNARASDDPALWMLCWTDLFQSPGNAGSWSAWVPLGGNYAGLGNGPTGTPIDTLFAIDSDNNGSLDALRQNPLSGVWTEGLVKRPSWSGDDIETVATYQTEAALFDGNGMPLASVPVTVLAESPVEAWINNVLYPLDPVRGVTVPTNARGVVLVKTLATGLHAPALQFQADGLGAGGVLRGGFGSGGVTVSPSQHVYDFLGNKGALPIGGAQPTKLTCAVLTGASFTPPVSASTAGTFVTNAGAITQMPAATAAALTAPSTRSAVRGELPGSWRSFWSGLKHRAESIGHAIEKGLATAAIEVGDGLVTIAVQVGDEISATFEMVIQTAEDAVRAIEMLVNTVVTRLEDFVKWLMLLLDWDKMLQTQQALIGLIGQWVDVAQTQMGVVQQAVASLFGRLVGDVTNNFDGIIASITSQGTLGRYASLGALPNSFPPSSAAIERSPTSGGAPGQAPAPPPVQGSSSVHHNWFLNKVLDHITPSFAIPAIPGVSLSAFLDALDPHSAMSDLQQGGEALLGFFKTAFTDVQQLATLGIVDLLTAAKDLITAAVNLLQGIVDAFLALAQAILAGMMEALQTRVDIPGISALFKLVTGGQDMTLLNLGTLIIAVPLYLLYNLIALISGMSGGLPFAGLEANAPSMMASPVAEVWAADFLAFGLINTAVAGLSDLLIVALGPEGDPKDLPDFSWVLTALSAILAIGMRIAIWPDPAGFPIVSNRSPTTAQVAAWFNWGAYCLVPLFTLATASLSSITPDVRTFVRSLIGLAGLITAFVTFIDEAADNTLSLAVGPLLIMPIGLLTDALLWTPLRLQVFEQLYFDTAIIKFFVNLGVHLGVPILHEVAVNLPP